MTVDLGGGYLSGLPEGQRGELARVNGPGLAALREYLGSGAAIAFLGAGASRPLYPLWDGLIGELLDAAAGRLSAKEEATCRALAHDSPEAVVEIVRRSLGPGVFREVLRKVLQVRSGPAEALTRRNVGIGRRNNWNESLAQCDRVLGRLALADGDTTTAGEHLAAAAACFRDGDYLTELADTLPVQADCARASGDLAAADRYATEGITIAAPRGLVPAHASALAARARLRAAQATAAGTDPGLLFQGRDAADAALRLATRHHLPWQELDGLRAHAALDQAEDVDRGWAAKTDALHARLVPPGLDPDPLAAVERLVAEDNAAGADQDKGDD